MNILEVEAVCLVVARMRDHCCDTPAPDLGREEIGVITRTQISTRRLREQKQEQDTQHRDQKTSPGPHVRAGLCLHPTCRKESEALLDVCLCSHKAAVHMNPKCKKTKSDTKSKLENWLTKTWRKVSEIG